MVSKTNMSNIAEHLHPQKPSAIFDLLYGRARGDSLIALGTLQTSRKNPDLHPAPFAPVMNRDRQQMLPGMLDHLAQNIHYVMPNTLKAKALVKTRKEIREEDPQAATWQHQEKAISGNPLYFSTHQDKVRELIALTIDLDVGRDHSTLNAAEALALVFYKTMTGGFPIPSVAAYSGRGAYLLYLLKGEDDPAPPLATPDAIHKWKLCCGELIKRTQDLESDPSCKSLVKWFKAPGSLVGDGDRRTVYMTFGVDRLDAVPIYSLDGMANALELSHALTTENIEGKYLDQVGEISSGELIEHDQAEYDEAEEAPTPTKGKKKKRKVKKGQGGQPFIKRAQEIDLIANHRGGISEGMRHMTLLYYHQALLAYYRKHFTDPVAVNKARRDTLKFNANLCKPPMTTTEIQKCLETKTLKARNQTIVENLKITPMEVNALDLQSLIPDQIKKTRLATKKAKSQALLAADREQTAAIRNMIKGGAKTKEIMGQFNISRQAVHQHRKKMTAELPPPDEQQTKLF